MKRRKLSKNLALKCNWNDSGYAGICSNEAYEFNVKVKKAAWCSNKNCECRYYEDSVINGSNYPCYESKLFVDYSFNISGNPYKIRQSEPGKIALLTTRAPGDSEADRFVFGYLLISKIEDDDYGQYSVIYGDPERSVVIDREVMRNLKFWNYYI